MKSWIFASVIAGALLASGLARAGGALGTQYEWDDQGYDSGWVDVINLGGGYDYNYFLYRFVLPASAPNYVVSFDYDGNITFGGSPNDRLFGSIELDTGLPPDPDRPPWVGDYPYRYVASFDVSGNQGHATEVLTPGSYFVTIAPTDPVIGRFRLTGSVVPVPEPETWALLGLGVVGLLARSRLLARKGS